MRKYSLAIEIMCFMATIVFLSGCVERKLTINTRPNDAIVVLNDEEVGKSPVTVNFNWYGDYKVRISKEGYQTLNTHRELKRPWYDGFPFDFFAQVLNPERIIDSYEWTFELEEKKQIGRNQLIDNAQSLREQLE
jgi:hypothetical protein